MPPRAPSPLPADLVDTISHGVRTPLMVITANAQLIRRSSPSSELVLRSTADIARAAGRLLHLFEDLVDYHTVREGRLTVQPQALQPGELLHGLAEGVAAALGEHPLHVEIASELPPVRVDPTLLGRALTHLLLNAANASEPGDPVLLRAVSEAGAVRIEVVDHGRGIDPADAEQIFAPFVRLPGARGGVGLGLFLVRTFVEAMGGVVTVASSPKRGSTFAITLPAIT